MIHCYVQFRYRADNQWCKLVKCCPAKPPVAGKQQTGTNSQIAIQSRIVCNPAEYVGRELSRQNSDESMKNEIAGMPEEFMS
jgi:hypothetical protein